MSAYPISQNSLHYNLAIMSCNNVVYLTAHSMYTCYYMHLYTGELLYM